MTNVKAKHLRTIEILFGIAIVLLPFNALPYFKSFFREMANEGAFYPMAVAILLLLFYLFRGLNLYLPKCFSFKVLAVFIIWVGVSGIANFFELMTASTKGRSGEEKFIFQYALLLFMAASSIMVYQLARESDFFLLKFRRFITYSLVLVCLYSFIEIPAILGDLGARNLLQTLDYFIRDEELGIAIFRRLRSVSGEPSYFAMYMGLIFPWVISYLATEEKRHFVYSLLVGYLIVLVLFTSSRSAFVTIGIEAFLFICGAMYFGRKGISQLYSKLLLPAIVLAVAMMALFFFEIFDLDTLGKTLISLGDTESTANMGRYGSQVAAFNMAVDNPLFGVGFGQYGFNMPAHVPDWAKFSPEMIEWMRSSPDSVWAPALGLYSRIAGELGFIGLGLWATLWISLTFSCYRRFKLNSVMSGRCDAVGLALLISLAGVLMSGLNSDSLRFFGYWILLGLCWDYLSLPKSPYLCK